ncbi:hypothetical protein [Streptomyces sp. SYSU K21746]
MTPNPEGAERLPHFDKDTDRPRNRMAHAGVPVFLEALRDGETVARSAVEAGMSPEAVYRRRRRDQAFAELMKDAQKAGLQARARRRERKRAPFRSMRYRLVQGNTDELSNSPGDTAPSAA